MFFSKRSFAISQVLLKKNSFITKQRMSSSTKPQVYITRSDMPNEGVQLLHERCSVSQWQEGSTVPRDVLLKNVIGKDAIYCTLSDKIDSQLLDTAGPQLKVISTISVGYDHIDVAECKKRGIKIGYTPNVLTDATAELTVSLLLCTSRRLIEAHKEAVSGGWKAWAPTWMTGPGLAGATVGIVGFGRIGQAVAQRVKAFNTSAILYYNRSVKSEAEKIYDAKKVSFDELLKNSDFVIACCALTPETEKIFNRDAFKKMKSSAIFVNTSRGGVVDQNALIEALKTQEIRGAGLDVTTPEPLPLDNPLFILPNCVVLPHIGSAAIEARATMSILTAENILNALNNTPMPAELKI